MCRAEKVTHAFNEIAVSAIVSRSFGTVLCSAVPMLDLCPSRQSEIPL